MSIPCTIFYERKQSGRVLLSFIHGAQQACYHIKIPRYFIYNRKQAHALRMKPFFKFYQINRLSHKCVFWLIHDAKQEPIATHDFISFDTISMARKKYVVLYHSEMKTTFIERINAFSMPKTHFFQKNGNVVGASLYLE